jgi:hypothetical protein
MGPALSLPTRARWEVLPGPSASTPLVMKRGATVSTAARARALALGEEGEPERQQALARSGIPAPASDA